MVPQSPFCLFIKKNYHSISSLVVLLVFFQLYHPCTPALLVYIPPSIPSSFSFYLNCLSLVIMSTTATCPRMSSILTLSILDLPSILCKHIISQAFNLLSCFFCTVHVSHLYRKVGTTITLKTFSFVSFLYSLHFNTSFLIASITLVAAPIKYSISSSLDPSAQIPDPKYIYIQCKLQNTIVM